MKKLLFFILLIGAVVAFSWLFNNQTPTTPPDVSQLFDERPQSQTEQKPDPVPQNPSQEQQNAPDQDAEKDAEKQPDTEETKAPENTEVQPDDKKADTSEPFSHSDAEKKAIAERYIRAEELYYSILYQQYELDDYDVITQKNPDGYETDYHRVIYYNVNSLDDLKQHYLEYFTEDFVASINFDAYIEQNGKLYCVITGGTSGNTGTKYAYSVHSTDPDTAYIEKTNTDKNTGTKIKTVKKNGEWYFTSVAIK